MHASVPKQLVGIYMDHHDARIMDARSGESRILHSRYKSRLREKGQSAVGTKLGGYRSTNNEANDHHQEQHDTIAYYKAIAESILPFDHIYIFGPTTAKEEFQNFLLKDAHFKSKVIRVESTDYITSNQQEAHVRQHYKPLL